MSGDVARGLSGALHARFTPTRRGTAAQVRTSPPLELRGPFIEGGLSRFFLRNVTAGILEGDCNDVTLRIEPGACVRVEPSSATRAFAAAHRGATSRLRVEALPDSVAIVSNGLTILHAGAAYRQTVELAPHPGARVAYLETLALGRSASGEAPSFRCYEAELTVRRPEDASPAYEERFSLHPSAQAHAIASAFGGYRVAGTAILIGCPSAVALPSDDREGLYWGSTALPDGAGVLVRALGASAEVVTGLLEETVMAYSMAVETPGG